MFKIAQTVGVSEIIKHLINIIILIIIVCSEMTEGLSSVLDKNSFINHHQEMYLITSSQSIVDTSRSGTKMKQIHSNNTNIDNNHHFFSVKTTVINDNNNNNKSNNQVSQNNNQNQDQQQHHQHQQQQHQVNQKKIHLNHLINDELSMKRTVNNELEEIYKIPMYFGTENSTMITSQIGATAHLPCTIHHIGEGVVSWIRRKDYHLLTVGLTTYSSDERYSATHLKHSEDWTLQIKFVQIRDAGLHECQVSTHPPSSIFIDLNVVEARAEIVGPIIRYLTPGSILKLICRIVQNTETSAYIFWYHDNRMINYDVDRGINVSTEADYHYSELSITHAKKEHSGNYTCVPSNAQPASVLVHIFRGDNPAAMYHDHRSRASLNCKLHQTNLAILVAALVNFVVLNNIFIVAISLLDLLSLPRPAKPKKDIIHVILKLFVGSR